MRLALLAWEALHAIPVGGAAVYAFRLASALARRGHEVHLFTRQGRGQRFSDVIEGVRYHRIPVTTHPDFLEEIRGLAVPFSHYLRNESARGGPFDRIHALDWLMVPAAFAALDDLAFASIEAGASPVSAGRGRTGPVLAMTFHGTEWGRSGAWPERGRSRAIAELERAALARADAVVAVTDRVRKELDALYRPPEWKTDTIRHGLDLSPFEAADFDAGAVKARLGWPADAPVVLCAGRMEKGRGVEALIGGWLDYRAGAARDAVEGVASATPFRLVFAGEGGAREGFAERIRLAGWGDEAGWIGGVTGRALADWYRVAEVVVSPLDALGSGALSAWAARKPVLAGSGSGSAEIVLEGVNGWRVEPTAEAWSRALSSAGENPDRRRWMGANGHAALAAAFTWDLTAERTEALYRRAQRLRERLTVDA